MCKRVLQSVFSVSKCNEMRDMSSLREEKERGCKRYAAKDAELI